MKRFVRLVFPAIFLATLSDLNGNEWTSRTAAQSQPKDIDVTP